MKASKRAKIENRLKKLRKRFGADINEDSLDKDFTGITSDDLGCIGVRTFFTGEIFWVGREGWQGCGGFYTNTTRDHHPGLVLRKQMMQYQPVEMVPGSKRQYPYLADKQPATLFQPETDITWKIPGRDRPDEQFFVLEYRRPVARTHISFSLGRLQHADTVRLQTVMRKIEQHP